MQSIAPTSPHTPSIDVLSPRTVYAKLGLNQTTIWRMRQRGEFPEPIRLSPGRVGWLRTDIEGWLARRAEAST